ncbi:hypothetical protein A2130_03735 [Candidatus Woesebacteria bacterium GWC2_33_12]|uniref:Uncharacterized protein n=1 Tax=Candidatus Woesebacteria bacterium GW2011_GWB1_33_22 TaxID=1618566 RepID=A0A0F9ZMP1_9BACT|nr:MAG: hypothetical protein UR29_C0001G0068 [Candidatus Woesebacteria bacterium GW2011_GWC2_33_12]KKP42722.1 MAG: hypothetical protein UR33_C0001G0083 [Candidatus Woesebacteria bacterium GW2011_GWA2_33_20]KKP45503.1 MAG: hypothetical protein UR35_C0001G0100 [Candidatus Woesebacteria bacterium GW2011_GWB1_33_22]KKP47375.1 MAG: hypothetical protein UR37_C0001G0068 [Microgenomates group bacterium GW2011_GWC1_33_28]KKP51121.1 MAG: hypothetical protein UR41_C0001G0068 [Candidatus Woesebacteria bact
MKKVILISLIFIHLYLLLNLKFTPWPEMLSFPYLFSNGFTLYKDFIIPYPPFLVILLSIIYKIFGYKILVLKIFTWALILLTDLFIYKIVDLVTKKKSFALISVAVFVFIQPFLDGNMLWFDTFLVLPVLVSVFFLLQDKNINKNILLAGVFLAISIFSKQTALIYLLVSTIFVCYKYRKFSKLLLLITPTFVFGVIFLTYLITTNSLVDFFNWNLIYPIKYWGDYPSYLLLSLKKIDFLILLGLSIPIIVALKNKVKLIPIMFIASLLAVYPRFSYYHLSVGIALFAICFGISLEYLKSNLIYKIILVFFVILFFNYQQRIVFAWDWQKEDRFTQSLAIQKKELVYLLNIASSEYVFSNTLPPKPWYDNYGWYLEIPDQQEKVIKSWKQNPPETIYWKKEKSGNWYEPGVYKPKQITSWIEANYEKDKEISQDIWLWRKK